MKNTILTTFSFALICSLSSQAEPAKISEKATTSNEVVCPNKIDKRTIVKTSSNQWCDEVFPDICSKDKIKVARRVCSNTYNTKKAKFLSQKKNEAPSITPDVVKLKQRDTLMAEMRQIELQQQLIKLKRKELDIRKRELEVSRKEQAFVSTSPRLLGAE